MAQAAAPILQAAASPLELKRQLREAKKQAEASLEQQLLSLVQEFTERFIPTADFRAIQVRFVYGCCARREGICTNKKYQEVNITQ